MAFGVPNAMPPNGESPEKCNVGLTALQATPPLLLRGLS